MSIATIFILLKSILKVKRRRKRAMNTTKWASEVKEVSAFRGPHYQVVSDLVYLVQNSEGTWQ